MLRWLFWSYTRTSPLSKSTQTWHFCCCVACYPTSRALILTAHAHWDRLAANAYRRDRQGSLHRDGALPPASNHEHRGMLSIAPRRSVQLQPHGRLFQQPSFGWFPRVSYSYIHMYTDDALHRHCVYILPFASFSPQSKLGPGLLLAKRTNWSATINSSASRLYMENQETGLS